MLALWKILVKYKMLLIGGVKITVIISILTILFGLIFGTLMAFMKMSKVRLLRWFAKAYVEFIRGTPVLVQISIVFYGLPMIGIQVPSIMFGGVDISRLVSGIVALTINSTAYICEIVRGGILSVDRGQTEGALALGMSNARTLLCIVLPQAMKNILPSLSNEFITIIKTSSQVSVIGIGELMYAADTIRGISFQPMAPLILVALIYFLITSVFSFILKKIEKRMSRSTQRVAN